MSSWSDKESGPATLGTRARAKASQILTNAGRTGLKVIKEQDARGAPVLIEVEPWGFDGPAPKQLWKRIQPGVDGLFERIA